MPDCMSPGPDTIQGMKTLSGISAITLLLCVGSLESSGGWWLLPFLLAACSLAALAFACGRLGCFGSSGDVSEEHGEACDVIPLHSRGASGAGGTAERRELEPGAAVTARRAQ